MKKSLALILLVIFVVTMAVGCAKEQPSTNSLEKVKTSGVLTMGLDDSFPPMEYRDDKNTLVGFDIDLGEAISKKLGVEAKFVTTDFSGIIEALKTNKFDIILSTLSITDDRKEKILFSEPYIMEGQIVAVSKDSAGTILTPADLTGKIVACQLGSTGEEAAKTLNGLKELKTYDKITEAFHDLSIGRIDAVVVDELVGRYYISTAADNYSVLADKITDEPVGMGFKKEDTALQAAVQKAFDDLKAEGTLSEISQKWFGTDIYSK